MVRKVYYVWDEKLISECDRLPAVLKRASMVHSLIVSYKLTDQIKVLKSIRATYTDLRVFHSDLYLNHLKSFQEIDEDDYMSNDQDEEYGIGYDCPPVTDMFELVSIVAGGSIAAAQCLVLGMADISINWCGGWHHAQRFGAEGFCYVNDIVLGIEKLRRKFKKVLYIDLDVHHGNGVQDAYNLSNSVFTLSFHKFEPGFYPGTGNIDDIGTLTGKGYTCNFPFHSMYTDETFKYAFEKVFSAVYCHFAPDAIVVQCGADALREDQIGQGQLTIDGYAGCLRMVLDKRKPTMLLGGGGYNFPNTARLWASLTAVAAQVTLNENIPEHRFWHLYGPDFTLNIQPPISKDNNKQDYLDSCINIIESNLTKYLDKNDKVYQCNREKDESEMATLYTHTNNEEKSKNIQHKSASVSKNIMKNRTCKYNTEDNKPTSVDLEDIYTFKE